MHSRFYIAIAIPRCSLFHTLAERTGVLPVAGQVSRHRGPQVDDCHAQPGVGHQVHSLPAKQRADDGRRVRPQEKEGPDADGAGAHHPLALRQGYVPLHGDHARGGPHRWQEGHRAQSFGAASQETT